MTLMLESGIFLAMGLQAFGIIEDADGAGGGLVRAAVIAVIAGSLIMVIRALFHRTHAHLARPPQQAP